MASVRIAPPIVRKIERISGYLPVILPQDKKALDVIHGKPVYYLTRHRQPHLIVPQWYLPKGQCNVPVNKGLKRRRVKRNNHPGSLANSGQSVPVLPSRLPEIGN